MSETPANSILKKNKRIWELDAFRGFCIIFVIISHLSFDALYIFPKSFSGRFFSWFADTQAFQVFDFINTYGGYLFIILSGICVTLGRRTVLRGLVVFGCGVLISIVSFFVADKNNYIYFGILHLLGVCMLLYPLYKRIPKYIILALGVIIIVAGIFINNTYIEIRPLIVLGFKFSTFSTGDWFPIFPCLGYFMIGNFIGRTAYKKKTTLFPKVKESNFMVRFLSWIGRKSLWIYLIHQPVLYAIFWLEDIILRK